MKKPKKNQPGPKPPVRVPLKNGGSATFTAPPPPELLEVINRMAERAFHASQYNENQL